MTADEFKSWRLARGWTQDQAAAAIGISPRVLLTYEKRADPVPLNVELAIEGLEHRSKRRRA